MLGDLGLVGGPEVAEREAELVGRLAHHVAPQPQKLAPALGAVKDKAGEDLGAEGVEAELEPRDDAEVAAAPRRAQNRSGFSSSEARTMRPSAVTSSAESRLSTVSPCFRSSHPEPPPSRPADAGRRDASPGGREAVLLGRAVDLGPQRAAADPRHAAVRVDLDRVHQAHVDHDAVVEQ